MGAEKQRRGERPVISQIARGCVWTFALLALVWILDAAIPRIHVGFDQTRGTALQALNKARQIHMGVQTAALDYANSGAGVGWPADSGVKTTREYIAKLVREGAFKETDLQIFCRPCRVVKTVKDLKPDDLAFLIGNVSETDESEIIFLATPNFSNRREMEWLLRPWWNPFAKDRALKDFVVFRKGGDGSMYDIRAKTIVPSTALGRLPPREPQFLPP